MKWIRCTHDGETFYGILDEDRITPVRGDPFNGHEKRNESLRGRRCGSKCR